MRVSDLFFIIAILAIGIFIGFLMGSRHQKFVEKRNQEVIASKKVSEDPQLKKKIGIP